MNPPRKTTDAAAREGGTIVALFRQQPQAERAIRDLKDAGFPTDGIGVVMQDPVRDQQLVHETDTLAGEGAAAGAISGGVIGGVLGLLAGVGAVALPGIGPIIAGGALASTLAGAGVGVATGGLLGALAGMGVTEEEARYYERGVRGGGILLTVAAGNRPIDARRILHDAGAELAPSGVRAAADVTQTSDGDQGQLELRDQEPWRGNERRYQDARDYTGPERRVARI